MPNPKHKIDEYSLKLEQLSLASEDLLQAAAMFKAVEALIEKDPFDLAAKRVAQAGRQIAERRSDYFEDEANALEAEIGQLEDEEEAKSCD